MLLKLLSFAVCSAVILPAQDDPTPVEPAAPAALELPAAKSAEARKMVDQAIDKMLAYGRGTFSTTTSQDQAMMRNRGLPFGANDTEVDGGWHRELIWGDWDGREFVTGNGRMLAKVDDEWRLRRTKLSGGMKAPFTLDPGLLFTVLKQLPADARKVVNVEAGKIRGRAVVILSLQLDNEDALEFADSGAVPDAGGGFGGLIMMGGMGRIGGMEPPRPDIVTYLAFFVDAENGDLLRFGAKAYETSQMMGNIQINIGGAGGGLIEEEEEEDAEEDAQGGPVKWKRGFPRKKPAKDESVMTFRCDFRKLGLAEPPALNDKLKALLRVH